MLKSLTELVNLFGNGDQKMRLMRWVRDKIVVVSRPYEIDVHYLSAFRGGRVIKDIVKDDIAREIGMQLLKEGLIQFEEERIPVEGLPEQMCNLRVTGKIYVPRPE